VKDFKERTAPLVDRYAESETRNETLNRQVEDLQSQNRISRDKRKMAELSVQTGKEEIERLRLVVERQRIAGESAMTEKNELQAKIERRDKEVLRLHCLSIHWYSFLTIGLKIKLLNTKLKALSKKQKLKSTRRVEDSDASLHVEPSKTVRYIPVTLLARADYAGLNNLKQGREKYKRRVEDRATKRTSDADSPRPFKKVRT